MKENKMRIVIIAGIIVICVICVGLAIYFSISNKGAKPQQNMTNTNENQVEQNNNNNIPQVSYADLEESFSSIFTNKLEAETQGLTVTKADETKELIYTKYPYMKSTTGYEINVNIPNINIAGDAVSAINEQINQQYQNRIKIVAEQTDQYVIYTASYVAYINGNILSVVIRENLKIGEEPQRLNILTYNYDITNNRQVDLYTMLSLKQLDANIVQQAIIQKINKVNQSVSSLSDLGYSVYRRNTSDPMYLLQNTKSYFLGKDGYLYLIYTYGDIVATNYTFCKVKKREIKI